MTFTEQKHKENKKKKTNKQTNNLKKQFSIDFRK